MEMHVFYVNICLNVGLFEISRMLSCFPTKCLMCLFFIFFSQTDEEGEDDSDEDSGMKYFSYSLKVMSSY